MARQLILYDDQDVREPWAKGGLSPVQTLRARRAAEFPRPGFGGLSEQEAACREKVTAA